jgi:hypothetical protein
VTGSTAGAGLVEFAASCRWPCSPSRPDRRQGLSGGQVWGTLSPAIRPAPSLDELDDLARGTPA